MFLREARVRQKNGRRQYPDVLGLDIPRRCGEPRAGVLKTGSRSCLEDATVETRDLTTAPCTAV